MPRNSSPRRRAGALTAALATGALATFATSPAGAVGDAAADGSYASTARLVIGDNLRGCTGALVDQYWVLTAASCFADDPAQPQALAAGAPKWKTTATVGSTSAQVVELAPRQDRDLVMARLAAPVSGVTPLTIATTAPTAGQTLRVAGFGRTKDEWVPNKLHTGAFSLDTVSAAGIGITGTGGAAVCKGDTGAPAIREADGKAELVAVASRPGRAAAWAPRPPRPAPAPTAPGSTTSAPGSRRSGTAPVRTVVTGSPFTVADPVSGHLVTFVQDSKNHLWSVDPQNEGWNDLGGYPPPAPPRSSTRRQPRDGVRQRAGQQALVLRPHHRKWTEFIRTTAGTVLAPDAVPRTVVDPATGHLVTFVRDTAHHLWSVDPQGEGWYDYGPLAATDPVPVVNPNDGHIVVYVNGPDNKLNSIDRRGAGRVEFVPTAAGTVLAADAVPSTVVDPATGHFTTFVRDTAHHLWSVDPYGPAGATGAGWPPPTRSRSPTRAPGGPWCT
ncbi:trypsin-like serine protease [Streptomyces sp. 1331.2]|uniref:trypsin-like serine protease n=1 Tax=Streptomyces sp. 1331.2 TaxID=1938835 RepID=UPI000BC96CBE|nr:trypsin-like serine protease [Streptomyces sp. 1331.2]SOB88398.1 Trypsin [Streptomyces sp. 1331.2]